MSGWLPTMPETLVPDWRSLHELLDRYGFPQVPCYGSDMAHLWTSDDVSEQRAAADECGVCPVIDQCRAYGLAHPRESGVYGGRTEAERQATR